MLREWWGSYSKTSISQSKSFTWPQFHRSDRSFQLNLHPGALNAGFHNSFLRPIFFRLELRATYTYVIYHNDDEKYLNLKKSRIQFFFKHNPSPHPVILTYFLCIVFTLVLTIGVMAQQNLQFHAWKLFAKMKKKPTTYLRAQLVNCLPQLNCNFFSSNFCHNM